MPVLKLIHIIKLDPEVNCSSYKLYGMCFFGFERDFDHKDTLNKLEMKV